MFYRESNGKSGLQIPGDTLIGTGTRSGTTWTFSMSTSSLAVGTYTIYAVATDSAKIISSISNATLTITKPPVNDLFAHATVISGTSVSVTGTNVGATTETGEPDPAGASVGKSVWWSWTAAASGTISVNTHGSIITTVLGVYTGTSVGALKTIVASANDATGVTFTAVKGTTYHILVDGYEGAAGTIKLSLT
jgi:hypothetical protein